MKCTSAALLAIVACGPALAATAAQRKTPVEKVVHLLAGLKAKIEQDGAVEGQTYDKYACWCEKTTARKAADIEQAQEDLRALSQKMLKLKGTIATLAAEIAQLNQAIKDNKQAQATATAIRQKENAAYQAETAEMKDVLTALEKAIIVLKNGTAPSFLQQGSRAEAAVQAVIKALPMQPSADSKRASLLSRFAAATQATGKYAPQSWTVQGILADMYTTFSTDLETATETEARKNRAYETFIALKTRELKALEALKAKKEGEKAEAESLLADTTQIYDDTSAQMKADVAFFDQTKAACEAKHAQWVTRSELRDEELDGIKRALEILTSDSARELFARAITPGKETHMDNSYDTGVSGLVALLQVMSTDGAEGPSARAYEKLRQSARETHSLRLAELAVRVREAKVGHFEAVIQAVDTMIQTLKDEDTADIAKRDQCISEYQKTASKQADLKWLIKNNNAAIHKLEREIEALTEEKAKTIQEITEVDYLMGNLTAQRQAENAEFLQAKKDDQDAITLLSQARSAMTSYYANNSIELGPLQGSVKSLALAAQGPVFEVSADQDPEAVFSHKGKRKHESKGIAQLLTMIMQDLDDEIKNAMKAEEESQLDYEKQMAAARKLRAELVAKVANLAAMIAKRQSEKSDEEADRAQNQADLEDEQSYKARITPDCDWIMGAFAGRAAKRATEMDGLVGAKEFLAGYIAKQAPAPALLARGGRREVGSHFLGLQQ